MIDFTQGKWEGLDGLSDELLRELRPQAERTVMKASLHLEAAVKKQLTGARSGRTYKISKTGKLHVASAPGESPANMTGALRNSIGHSDPEWSGWEVSQLVGPGLGQAPASGEPDPGKAYARRMEYGGVDSRGVNIEARPYMEPAVQESEAGMNRIFQEGIGS